MLRSDRYRSLQAQDIHTNIVRFLNRGCSYTEVSDNLKNIYKFSPQAFCETSESHHSCLMDIFHLGKKLIEETRDPETKKQMTANAVKLTELLFSILDAPTRRFLMTTPTKDNITPLLAVLRNSDSDLACLFLRAVQVEFQSGNLSPHDYRILLTQLSPEDCSPLLYGLHAGNKGVYAYLSQLEAAYDNGILTSNEYKRILIGTNNRNYTPFHNALKGGHPQLINDYLNILKTNKVISPIEYKSVLLARTETGDSALHLALANANSEIIKIYLLALETLFKQKILSPQEFNTLLTRPNNSGFTPFLDVLSSQNLENVTIYLELLRWAHKKGIISKDEYRIVLIQPNHAGFTPMQHILKINNLRALNLYRDELETAYQNHLITIEDFRSVFLSVNREGYTSMLQAVSGSDEIFTAYLDFLKTANRNRIVTDEEFKAQLISANRAGYTPLLSILMLGNVKNLVVYLDEVKKRLSARELRVLVMGANRAGYTTLHQAAASGSLEMCEVFVRFIEDNFKTERGEMIRSLLRARNKHDEEPTCKPSKPEARRIYGFLKDLGEKYNHRPSDHHTLWADGSRKHQGDDRDRSFSDAKRPRT